MSPTRTLAGLDTLSLEVPTLPAPTPSADPAWERYEDLGPIGRGGMAEVRRVRDRRTGAVVAMKIQTSPPTDARAARRFAAEVRLTAQLQHPSVVAIQDTGLLPDGRRWFTMAEVHGRTLDALIAEGLPPAGATGEPPGSGWTLRRRVDAFSRLSACVGHAHARGVIHRDLKPSNLMVGEHGDVWVMDWGIALDLGGDPTTSPPGEVERAGTPRWMAPEQAGLRQAPLSPATDVYALGCVLRALLDGSPSEALGAIVARATDPDPQRRFSDARALTRELQDWLDGARRAEEAGALVERAQALDPAIQSCRAEAATRRAEASRLLAALRPDEPADRKIVAWTLEDEAQAGEQRADRLEREAETHLRAAQLAWPEGLPPRRALGEHLRQRLIRAEAQGQVPLADELAERLRGLDLPEHRAFLQGDGALSLLTDPPGARATLYRYTPRARRLVPVLERPLGLTPLERVAVPRGSWLVLLEAPGRAPLRLPIALDRGEHWDHVPPGERSPTVVRLPRLDELGPDDLPVPPGPFRAGGDPLAPDGLPARRVWVDGLVARRHPVTVAEYLAFLRASADEGHDLAPLLPYESDGRPAFRWRGPLPARPEDLDPPHHPAHPVTRVDLDAMHGFIAWERRRTGEAWRLPHDLEWEKAARGVDGRPYPWGAAFDVTFCRMAQSLSSAPCPCPVTEHPMDEGPYGLRGAAGNVRERCANAYRREGLQAARIPPGDLAAPGEPLQLVRGGSWQSNPEYCRLAARFVWRPGERHGGLGFRLVRDAP